MCVYIYIYMFSASHVCSPLASLPSALRVCHVAGSPRSKGGRYIYIYICLWVCMYICIYTYIYTHTYIHICVTLYVWREREREMYVCVCTYIYIYTHTHTYRYILREREREKSMSLGSFALPELAEGPLQQIQQFQ